MHTGGFQKGNKFGHRPRGPNKLGAQIRQMVEVALTELGGVAYLVKCGKEQPVAFLHLVGKLVPKDVEVAITSRTYVITPEQAKSMELWTEAVRSAEQAQRDGPAGTVN